MKRFFTTPVWVMLGILFLAAGHRAFLAWSSFHCTPDSGSVGLMALHILEGERPFFLYGFNYSGALLPYVMALVFKVAGVSMVTFVGSAVLFTLAWVVVTYLLFRELMGTRAGLAAALCVAMADMVTAWYSMAPDCSYTPMCFLGTTALWLAVRIARGEPGGARLWALALALGATSALAVWTHMLTVVYLLCAGAIVFSFLVRRRFRIPALLPFLGGAAVAVLGLVPYLFAEGEGGSVSAKWSLFPAALQLGARLLVRETLPDMIFWPYPGAPVLKMLVAGVLVVACLLFLLRVVTRDLRGWAAGLPFAMTGVFLVFYLPHDLATEPAARYLVPAWSFLVCAVFAAAVSANCRVVRRAGGVVLVVWMAYHVAGLTVSGTKRRPQTRRAYEEYQAMIDGGLATGTGHVMLLDEYEFAAYGQTITFLARDAVRFVAADEERYQAAAQSADEAPLVAFGGHAERHEKFTHALQALDATWKEREAGPLRMTYDVVLPETGRRSIPPREMRVAASEPVSGRAVHVLDRQKNTMLLGRCNGRSGITLDLGEARRVVGLAFSPTQVLPHGLPTGYRVEGSNDGLSFHTLKAVEGAMPYVYRQGGRVYSGGGYGWMECAFPAEQVRYVRWLPTASGGMLNTWYLDELFVFEEAPAGPANWVEEREAVVRELESRGVEFAYADRWISSALLRGKIRCYDAPRAYPRYNEHLRIVGALVPFGVRRFRPAIGEAIVVAQALAGETETVLSDRYGEALGWERVDFNHYAVFHFNVERDSPKFPRLWWNGFLPLKMRFELE